jgi:hypothetical protein
MVSSASGCGCTRSPGHSAAHDTGVAEALHWSAAAAALVGGLQTDAINLKSLEDKVEHLLHPTPGLGFAGTHRVGVSATELGMSSNDFVESLTIDAET